MDEHMALALFTDSTFPTQLRAMLAVFAVLASMTRI